MQPQSMGLKNKQELILRETSKPVVYSYQVRIKIHDVKLCLHVQNEEIIKELYDHYPLAWFLSEQDTVTLDVFWTNSRGLGIADLQWQDEASPDCYIVQRENAKVAVQRDFAALLEGKRCHLICPYDIDDGFFNFLRWLLPLEFIKHGQLLLHSSCVLDSNNRAFFSIGPSGAGKSTISSFRPAKKILGDDMNVIKISDGQCYAQAGALGQALLNPREYSNWYPVHSIFWLKKAERVSVQKISKSTQFKYLSSAVANIFWQDIEINQVQRIFNHIQEILKFVQLYELSFPRQENIWSDIFKEIEKQQVGDI